MTRWVAFAALSLFLLVTLLLFARASQSVVSGSHTAPNKQRWLDDRLPDGAEPLDVPAAPDPEPKPPTRRPAIQELSSVALLANVAASHGLFLFVLIVGIWLTDIPVAALGITGEPLSTGPLAIAVGLALGAAISLANTMAAGLVDVFDVDPSEQLRELLAPDSRAGWVLLLVVVLPIIAIFEELLFRAVLIGAFSVGFDLSPWLLAVLSSVAFAAGHGAQGGLGVVVTGLLGFVLAVVFILTNSLLVVVVAHYLVNAVEFVVVEGIGYEPSW